MQGRATCGINRCELITQLHGRKLCHHSDKTSKSDFSPVLSFFSSPEVCSVLFRCCFSLPAPPSPCSMLESRGSTWKDLLPTSWEALSRTAASEHRYWFLVKRKQEVLHGQNRVSPACLQCRDPCRGRARRSQAAPSLGFSTLQSEGKWE